MRIFRPSPRSVSLTVMMLALVVMAGAGGDLRGGFGPGGKEQSPWSPNPTGGSPADYAGTIACAECHNEICKTQRTTDMANAAARPAESPVLQQHPTLSVEDGPYTYRLETAGKQAVFSVSDGHEKIVEPVVLVVGTGVIHQSYLIQHKDAYYQVPVGYYSRSGRLRFVGKSSPPAASLESALGERLTPERIQSCRGCHGTLNGVDAPLESDRLVFGVTCEACHGAGAKHVAAMRAGHSQDMQIFHPARLNPNEELEFCGRCHPYQGMKDGSVRGIATVASQAYRLTQSRCWNPDDKRSRCTFCHNPHAPLQHAAAGYDAQCLSCHSSQTAAASSSAAPGKPCPVGKQNCASCHMPQVEIPGSNASYTDHRIRVVRTGEAFPE